MKSKITESNRGFEPNMAYPQYEGEYRRPCIVISTRAWIQLQEYVLEKSNNLTCGPNQNVRKHWDDILAGIVPFGMRIVKE